MLRFIILVYSSFSTSLFAFSLPIIEQESDSTQWMALFALAAVGLLYMLLSSYQIKHLKKEYIEMKKKYKFLEEKQHNLLEEMGESIHEIAKQALDKTSILVEKTKESPIHEEIQSVMHNENELLDVTSNLMQFLQLKSKKITIRNEVFNFNNVLNEIIGLLSKKAKKYHTELIFDIDKNVPNSILADSSHLGKILVNLLEYFIEHSKSNKVRLLVHMQDFPTEKMQLLIDIEGDIKIHDKEHFFETRDTNKSKENMGLTLFIAKELIDLMKGNISIKEKNNSDTLHITLPIQKAPKETDNDQLNNNAIINKHILICDLDDDAATSLEKRLSYFNIKTTIKSQKDFQKNIPDFNNYDIVMLNQKLFTPKIIDKLLLEKKRHAFKIIAIDNLYNESINTLPDIIDFTLYKPFSPEYILNLLQNIYASKQNNIKNNTILDIHKKPFTEILNIDLEHFSKFSGKRLLLVEDNFINQKLIQSVLSKSNLIIELATNGVEALAYLENHSQDVDFILMDINMPVMDGFTATQEIRKQPRYNHIPIIALTALVADYEIVKMFSLGMNGYLSKPIKLGRLYAAFDMFLETKDIAIPTDTQEKMGENNLDGLDTEYGLTFMHNNLSLYKELLHEFMDAYEKSDIVLELLINKGRFEEAKKLSLDIKGLAETIGAKELSEFCNEIYNRIVYKQYDKVKKYPSQYNSLLKTLKASINTYLGS